MALFDNIGNLMSTLMGSQNNEETKNLASQAGVDTRDFSKIASVGLPLILQGMNRNNQSPEGLESFNQALNQHQNRNNYDSLNQFSINVDREEGDKILDHVLKGEKDEVSDSLAGRLGVNSDTVKKVLAVLAPLAIKYLADRKKEKNLDARGVQQETQNLTQEAAMQARNIEKKESSASDSLLGSLLGGLTDDTNNQKKDGGLLGSLSDLFK